MSNSIRSSRESLRNNNNNNQQQQRRVVQHSSSNNSFSSSSDGHPINSNNTLDLFSSKSRTCSLDHHTTTTTTTDHHALVVLKLGRLSINNNKIDDFLSSHQSGKHDYDWLLTPPGTPLVAADDTTNIIAPRRSLSTTKPSPSSSRLSDSRRSTSLSRPSLSTSQYSNNVNVKSTNILNTSSASVSSYIARPSTPARPSSARSSVSRSSTPSRPRPDNNKPKPSQNSRPSTPTSRSQNSRPSTPTSRSLNRVTTSSTPTRRPTTPSLSPVSAPSTTRNARNSLSRPSSPSPRLRSTGGQPIDFPLDTPPNLRTTLPDRPISAGRSRPAVAKGNEMANNNSSARGRQSSPVVSRGRLSESAARRTNENLGDSALDSRRELLTRKPAKTSTDTTGFGRTISKKSLDMAIKHMDIRNGNNGSRPLTGSNLFPQSIRSSNQRSQSGAISVNRNHLSMGTVAENGNHFNARFYESGVEENRNRSSAKLSNIDIYESSRYDMVLLKEDLTNTNWLHSLDDKTDQGPIFDNGFELLPEPFDPL